MTAQPQQSCGNCDHCHPIGRKHYCDLERDDIISIVTGEAVLIEVQLHWWCPYWDGEIDEFDLPAWAKDEP